MDQMMMEICLPDQGRWEKKTPEWDTLWTVSPLNVERIIAVKDTAYAVAKRELEKICAFLDSNPDNWDTSAVL